MTKAELENKKILLGLLTVTLIFAIIIVSSFWPFIFDPSRIGTMSFLTDQMIIAAITIATTVTLLFMAKAGNAQNPKSKIAMAKVAFAQSLARIAKHTFLYKWIEEVMQPRDRMDVAKKGMLRLGVNFRIWDLTDTEICSLYETREIDGKKYKALTKAQIKGLMRLRKSVKHMHFVKPQYYTDCESYMNDKNLSQIASGENTKKVLLIVFDLFSRMLLTFMTASIFTSLVLDLTEQGGGNATAWLCFLSRMSAFVSSMLAGYMMGCKANDTDAFYINKRVEAHTMYLEDRNFKPIDDDVVEIEKPREEKEQQGVEENGKRDCDNERNQEDEPKD